jgi:hypothetical protein
MRQVRTIEVTLAAPLDGRARRSNETLLRLDERNRYLIEASKFLSAVVIARSRGGCIRR